MDISGSKVIDGGFWRNDFFSDHIFGDDVGGRKEIGFNFGGSDFVELRNLRNGVVKRIS